MTAPAFASEAELQERWCAGLRGALRTEDGRPFRVVFPGVPGGGAGPDVRDAVIDLDGDELRGDVEFHLRAASWHGHGHATDPAYAGVVLHVVGANDGPAPVTYHRAGRVIPMAVIPGQPALPAFEPPCSHQPPKLVRVGLRALGARRLQRKAAAARLQLHRRGDAGLLYALLLETLGGPANRETFRNIAARLPLAPLLERASAPEPATSADALYRLLGEAATGLPFVRRGLRPAAFPERRLEAASGLVASLWPAGPSWPDALAAPTPRIVRSLRTPGIGADMATELAVNAVLPVAVAAGRWREAAAAETLAGLRAPSAYGRLKRLDGWLSASGDRPFTDAAALQGGLLLHAEWCARGRCGRCPLTS